MIEIKGVYKRYYNHHGSNWVLKDINLKIPSGVSVGLVGANGAGKSTLLRIIAGMDSPDKGEVIRHTRVSWPVGLTGGMQGSLTGRQNVKFVARIQNTDDDIDNIIKFVQEFSEIGEAFDEPVKTYSSGMRARLSFGLSLAFDFDVYISDEATAVGDRNFKNKARKLFKERVGQSSLIIVSHAEGILKELCQAGIYIKNQQAVWYDSIHDAISAYHATVDEKSSIPHNKAVKNKDPLAEKIHNERLLLSGLAYILKTLSSNSCPKYLIEGVKELHSKKKLQVEDLQYKFREDNNIDYVPGKIILPLVQRSEKVINSYLEDINTSIDVQLLLRDVKEKMRIQN